MQNLHLETNKNQVQQWFLNSVGWVMFGGGGPISFSSNFS